MKEVVTILAHNCQPITYNCTLHVKNTTLKVAYIHNKSGDVLCKYNCFFFFLPWTGGILASMEPCSKLTHWLKKVDIVTANKVLGQVDDC